MSNLLRPAFFAATLMAGAFGLPSSAFAKATKSAPAQPTAQAIRVSIPTSALSQSMIEAEPMTRRFPALHPEFSAMFWRVSEFQAPTRLSSEAFGTGAFPLIAASVVSDPTSTSRLGSLRWYGGAGFGRFSRAGVLPQALGGRAVTQDLWIVPVRLGAQFESAYRIGNKVQPLFFAGIMPSLAIAKTSAFGEGLFELGFPVETGIGASFPLSSYARSLGVSTVMTAGRLAGGSLFGFGLRASVEL